VQIGVLMTKPGNEPSSARYAGYVTEILAHAGLPWIPVDVAKLEEALPEIAVLVLPAHRPLEPEQQAAINSFVQHGNVLIACGGTSGLDGLLGCRDQGPLAEAWFRPVGDGTHAVIQSMDARHPLHAFGGRLVEASSDVTVLAEWLEAAHYCSDSDTWSQASLGPAATIRRAGTGYALLIAADLVHSVVRIQQGKPIHFDGQPAADGTAPVNDGILKTDDGLVLDYERDRVPVADTRFFGYGIADQWRELLIRAVLWGLQTTKTALPMLWYWPELTKAVGLLSHDTDGNDPALAEVLLGNLCQLGVPSTWCLQYPGGYAPTFYRQLNRQGYEIALHYDAFTQRGRAYWREDDFRLQLDWLRDMAGTPIISNKNHYLRWQGLDEFFVWLERAGVLSDESKGPSKTGNTGFPFGGCHPWFPVHEHTLRMIDVLEVNLATQDLALTCPAEVGPAVVDWALAHYGVAHFLFHPAHAAKPPVAEAMRSVVTYAQGKGIPWWTNNQIQDWERRRRQVSMRLSEGSGVPAWTVEATQAMPGATLLWFGSQPPSVAGTKKSCEIEVYGFKASAFVVDLEAGQELVVKA
jgi:hypothetical protein